MSMQVASLHYPASFYSTPSSNLPPLAPPMHASIAMQTSSWSHPYRGPSDSLASPSENGSLYSPLTPQNGEITFTTGHSMPQSPIYAGSSQPGPSAFQCLSPLNPSHDGSAMCFEHIDSSVGPSRVRTRGQQRALEATTRRRFGSSPYPSISGTGSPHRNHQTLYLTTSGSTMSRPGTPAPGQQQDADHDWTSQSPEQSKPANGPAGNTASPELRLYTMPLRHTRRDSSSNAHPRQHSPAESVVTSVSSASGPPNTIPQHTLMSTTSVLPYQRRERAKHRKQRLFNVDRKAICIYHRDNPTARQEDIAVRYGVERSTISKILKQKQKWMNVPSDEELRVAKHRPSKFPGIETQMRKWLLENQSLPKPLLLTDMTIRNKAKDIAREQGYDEDRFKASSGWVENFKNRCGIRGGQWDGGNQLKTDRSPRLDLTPPPSPPMKGSTYDTEGRLIGELSTTADGPRYRENKRSLSNTNASSLESPLSGHLGLTPFRSPWGNGSTIRDPSMMIDTQSVSASHPPLIPHLDSSARIVSPTQMLGSAQGHLVLDNAGAQHSTADGVLHHSPTQLHHGYHPPLSNATLLQDAQEHMEKVVLFFNTHGHDLLADHEMRQLEAAHLAVRKAGNRSPSYMS